MVKSGSTKRRTLLKTIGASGTSIGIATLNGNAAEGDSTTIVTDIHKGKAIATKEVPTEWYNRVQKTRLVQDSLYDRYSDKPWLVSVSRKSGEGKIGGKPAHVLEVGVTNESEISIEIPTEVNGIPIDVQERTLPEPHSCTSCDCNTYSCYEGGGIVDTEEQDGELHAHSGCIIAEHPNYSNPGLLTCAHGMGDCGDSLWNQEVRAGADPGLLVGYCDEWGWELDWSFTALSSVSEVDGLADEVVPYTDPVVGHVTKDGVDDMISSGEVAGKYGMATCHTTGKIDRIDKFTVCNGAEEWIGHEASSDGGDSGGAHFRVHDSLGVITILGVHHGWDNMSWVAPAYRLNNKHEIQFGRDGTC